MPALQYSCSCLIVQFKCPIAEISLKPLKLHSLPCEEPAARCICACILTALQQTLGLSVLALFLVLLILYLYSIAQGTLTLLGITSGFCEPFPCACLSKTWIGGASKRATATELFHQLRSYFTSYRAISPATELFPSVREFFL